MHAIKAAASQEDVEDSSLSLHIFVPFFFVPSGKGLISAEPLREEGEVSQLQKFSPIKKIPFVKSALSLSFLRDAFVR